MNPIRCILAATDLSAPARIAVERAAHLAHEHRASLTLMHVMAAGALRELRAWLGGENDAPARLESDAIAAMGRLAAEMREAHPVAVDTVCRPGDVPAELRREADARSADLLVLGAQGEGAWRHLMPGTTAERTLRHTTRPLLVVRQAPREHYRRVLVACDFSPWTQHALRLAASVAPQARLLLFHAWEVPFAGKLRYAGVDAATIDQYRVKSRADASREVFAAAEAADLAPDAWDPLVVEGGASQRLVEQQQKCAADLVVMGKHGQSATVDQLFGSVTHRVLAESSADVLVSTRRVE